MSGSVNLSNLRTPDSLKLSGLMRQNPSSKHIFYVPGWFIPLPPLVNSEQKMTVLGSTESATKGRPCPRLDRHPAARASVTFAPDARPNHVATPRNSSNWEICATSTTEENVASKIVRILNISRGVFILWRTWLPVLQKHQFNISHDRFRCGANWAQKKWEPYIALPTRKAISQH